MRARTEAIHVECHSRDWAIEAQRSRLSTERHVWLLSREHDMVRSSSTAKDDVHMN